MKKVSFKILDIISKVRKKIISKINFPVDDDSTPGENAWNLFWFVCLSIFYLFFVLFIIIFVCFGLLIAARAMFQLSSGFPHYLSTGHTSVLKLISKRPVILTSKCRDLVKEQFLPILMVDWTWSALVGFELTTSPSWGFTTGHT
jgi:hypothetical protein